MSGKPNWKDMYYQEREGMEAENADLKSYLKQYRDNEAGLLQRVVALDQQLAAAKQRIAELERCLGGPQVSEVQPDDLYYIQDARSFTGNSVMWWRPDGGGYTCDLSKAWRVTKEKAQELSRDRKTDVAWPCRQIDPLAQQHIDWQDMRGLTAATLE